MGSHAHSKCAKDVDTENIINNVSCHTVVSIPNPVYAPDDQFTGADMGFTPEKVHPGVNDYTQGRPPDYNTFVGQLKQRVSLVTETWRDGGRPVSLRKSCVDDLNISGVKVICGASVHIRRRLVWGALLLAMTIVWVVTFAQRTAHFMRTPTVLHTNTIYSKRIAFPSVTICNMNLLRGSGSYGLLQHEELPQRRERISLYSAVTSYFTVLESWSYEASLQYNSTYSPIWNKCYHDPMCDELLRAGAHKKENLISRCSWRGRECGPDNFTDVMTDMGLCFRWNGGEIGGEVGGESGGKSGGNIHHVESAGISGGLQLDLNIEQYDYMKSLREVAGAYAIVQDQEHQGAMIDGHGFVVTRGSYVTVGLHKRTELDNPYSKQSPCRVGRSQLYCIDKCYTSYLTKQCGCRDPHMEGNYPVCSVEKHLSCLHPKRDEFPSLANFTEYCGNCKHSCNRTKFEILYTSVPFSNFFASSQIRHLQSNAAKLLSHYTECLRLRDWANINYANESYVERLYDVSVQIVEVFNTVNKELQVPVETLKFVSDKLDDFDGWNRSELVVLKDIIETMNQDYTNLADYTEFNFLFNYTKLPYRMAEDINVRMAVVIMRSLNDTHEFLANVMISIREIDTKITDINAQWDMIKEQCIDSNITNNNETINVSTIPPDWESVIGNRSTIETPCSCQILDTLVLLSIRQARNITTDLFRMFYTIATDYTLLVQEIAKEPFLQKREHGLNINTVGEEFYKENYARLQIYYRDMSYTNIERVVSYDSWALTSDVGGSLGLFLGGSVLTLMEVADIFMLKLMAKICRKKGQRQNDVTHTT